MNNTRAIYTKEDILEVTPQIIKELKRKALDSKNKRFRLCMHHSNAHQTQEMIIVFNKGTFMPPHRHPKGKSESYHIIEGDMIVYFFNNKGEVIKKIEMGSIKRNKTCVYRLSNSIWHMPLVVSEWLVYHETYSGPFKKEYDVEFPCWAPPEEDKKKVRVFLDSLKAKG